MEANISILKGKLSFDVLKKPRETKIDYKIDLEPLQIEYSEKDK